jgi:hypothetical protein
MVAPGGSWTVSVAFMGAVLSAIAMIVTFDLLVAFPPPDQRVTRAAFGRLENVDFDAAASFLPPLPSLATLEGNVLGIEPVGDAIVLGSAPMSVSRLALDVVPPWKIITIDGSYSIGIVSNNLLHMVPRDLCLRTLGLNLYPEWIPGPSPLLTCAVPLYCSDRLSIIVNQCFTIDRILAASNDTVLLFFT